MTSIEARMREDIKVAMKAGRREQLEVLRMLMSDLKNAAIQSGLERTGIGDEIALAVLRRGVKTRSESADLYAKGGRQDLEQRELMQIEVLRQYLPAELSDAELEVIVDTVIVELGAKGKRDMGRVMKEALSRTSGRVDGKKVSAIVGARLT
jgi:uncharacterized protein YqeY